MTNPLHLLCAGAAQGVVQGLQDRFLADTGAHVEARFGAVGAMKEALLSGAPCDAIVLTQSLIEALDDEGRVQGATARPLGRVRTGVAVKTGSPAPAVGTPDELRAALRAATAVYFPDAVRSTAGIHFAGVLRELGLWDELQPRLRTYPNGATAMRELAACPETGLLGCTQVTEIRYTPGVDLVALLPARFELATVYTAAVTTGAASADLAARLVAMLGGPATQAQRSAAGFEL